MTIMNIVWPVTGLYFPLAGWLFYKAMGRPMAADAPRMTGKQPYWKSKFLSATYCGSGCVIGDIMGVPIVFAAGWTLLGQRLSSRSPICSALRYNIFPFERCAKSPYERRSSTRPNWIIETGHYFCSKVRCEMDQTK